MVWPHTFVSPSADSRRADVSYWQKYVHEVLANRLGGLSLPRKSVFRLTDRPDMTLDVYRGRKTTTTTIGFCLGKSGKWIIVRQGPIVLAVCPGGGCLDSLWCIIPLSRLPPSLGDEPI